MRTALIPGLYLARQATQQTGREVRAALRESAAVLREQAALPSAWVDVPAALRAQAEAVARKCAWLFIRSSACVEGRNGQLALWHHHLHRIPPGKLAALTVIHNFVTLRGDGSTPAQQFFGQPHRDLFEYLCEQMPDPPHTRRRSRSAHETSAPDTARP